MGTVARGTAEEQTVEVRTVVGFVARIVGAGPLGAAAEVQIAAVEAQIVAAGQTVAVAAVVDEAVARRTCPGIVVGAAGRAGRASKRETAAATVGTAATVAAVGEQRLVSGSERPSKRYPGWNQQLGGAQPLEPLSIPARPGEQRAVADWLVGMGE